MATRAATAATAIRRSPIVAAVLSFLLPGLGHGWLGAFHRGLVLALPVLLLIGFAAGTVVFQGRVRTLGLVLQPSVLVGLLIVNAGLLIWRAAAIVDAYLTARRWAEPFDGDRHSALAVAVLSVLLVVTLGMHVGVGIIGLKTYDTVTTVFATLEPTATPQPTVEPSLEPGATPPPAMPTPVPEPSWADDGRLDVLLVGGDAGPGRWSLRTDTMILLSVEVSTGRAALFGIPRNMRNVPLPEAAAAAFPECACYPDLLNSLYVYAGQHPEHFRGGEQRGYLALQDAVGELVDRELDGMLVVTLQGFVRLVDALGGLDITTPYSVYDVAYPHENGVTREVIWIPAGRHHMDGHTALAFARSRHQDTDYDRMYRQQLVLAALRRQVCPGDLVLRIPELLDIARDSLWTNLAIGDVPDLLELGNRVEADSLGRYQFWPPEISGDLDEVAIARVRQMVADAFATVPSVPGASGSSTPAPTPARESSGC
ncbi:MAG TPA: LCP family protein [candidate division Zixibacteria bacterium]|nr:LCP family protein [candidate division Zixibacteria bacterium]